MLRLFSLTIRYLVRTDRHNLKCELNLTEFILSLKDIRQPQRAFSRYFPSFGNKKIVLCLTRRKSENSVFDMVNVHSRIKVRDSISRKYLMIPKEHIPARSPNHYR
jgi:hypothetical protein